MISLIDFYIVFPGHPRYQSSQLIEEDPIRVIVQKYEMILFTIKGEVMGDPGFGASLDELLHQTLVSKETVEEGILTQIKRYIPELNGRRYLLKVEFFQDPTDFREIMIVYFQIADVEVYSIFGDTTQART